MKFHQAADYAIKLLDDNLPDYYFYHSVFHTQLVADKCACLSRSEGIGEEDFLLIQTAAFFHDLGYTVKPQDNEIIAGEIAGKVLADFDYTSEQINKIKRIILSSSYPYRPQTLAEQIICDADLSYLGSDDFLRQSQLFRWELAALNKTFTEVEWLQFEYDFLKDFSFFTRSARTQFMAMKNSNCEQVLKVLNVLTRKNLHS